MARSARSVPKPWLLRIDKETRPGLCAVLLSGESASGVRPCLCRRDGLNRIGAECRAARVRRSESDGKRPSLLTAAANVGTAKQTSARRKTRVAAGGADNGLHGADDDGRLAAA